MQLIHPFGHEVRQWGYLGLVYLDDFLVVPSCIGKDSTKMNCSLATVYSTGGEGYKGAIIDTSPKIISERVAACEFATMVAI